MGERQGFADLPRRPQRVGEAERGGERVGMLLADGAFVQLEGPLGQIQRVVDEPGAALGDGQVLGRPQRGPRTSRMRPIVVWLSSNDIWMSPSSRTIIARCRCADSTYWSSSPLSARHCSRKPSARTLASLKSPDEYMQRTTSSAKRRIRGASQIATLAGRTCPTSSA